MYPFFRFAYHMFNAKRQSPIGLLDTHEIQTLCWPWDLDLWNELNNGRTLTLYDLGRVPMALRMGLVGKLRENGWGFTMAGSSVRYRRRVQIFARLTLKTRIVCWDDKFLYMEQSLWKSNGECASHGLMRTAIVGDGKMIPMAQAAAALGHDGPSPEAPDWVRAWIDAEALRPWPPMQEG